MANESRIRSGTAPHEEFTVINPFDFGETYNLVDSLKGYHEERNRREEDEFSWPELTSVPTYLIDNLDKFKAQTNFSHEIILTSLVDFGLKDFFRNSEEVRNWIKIKKAVMAADGVGDSDYQEALAYGRNFLFTIPSNGSTHPKGKKFRLDKSQGYRN